MSKFVALYDLEPLTETQRQEYVVNLCQHMGIPPELNLVMLTYLDEEDGPRRLVPWVKRGGTEIIRNNKGINISEITSKEVGGSFVVTARATNTDGRQEIAVGSKWISGLTGKDLDDAIMTAQTRACRRVTLQFVGAGVLDESEINPALRVSAKQTTPIAIAPIPTVQPASEPGKDITPAPEMFVGQQEQIDAAYKQLAEKKTREEAIALINKVDEPVVDKTPTAEAEPVKRKGRGKARPKVDLGPGEPPVSVPTQRVESIPAVPAIEAPAPEPPKAQPVPAPTQTGTPLELVKPFKVRLFKLTQELEINGGFAPKEGVGNQAKLQQFMDIAFSDFPKDRKLITPEQWEKYVSLLESKLATAGPAGTVAYIEDTIGL